jgi:hypothetical protein
MKNELECDEDILKPCSRKNKNEDDKVFRAKMLMLCIQMTNI